MNEPADAPMDDVERNDSGEDRPEVNRESAGKSPQATDPADETTGNPGTRPEGDAARRRKSERVNVVDVRIGSSCRRISVRAAKFKDLPLGKPVIAESDVGPVLGVVVSAFRELPVGDAPGRRILRVATDHDCCQDAENRDYEDDGRRFCIERIQARQLPMHLVMTEVSLDRRKFLFYFTADGRVDFRDLVKDLASQFRTRIEMRQIGSRDETKMLGGLGPCGQEVCCHRWLDQFVPISIKMAKQQDLSLNPAKISGLCGRLMCCLVYEYDPKAKRERRKKKEITEPEKRRAKIVEKPPKEDRREQKPAAEGTQKSENDTRSKERPAGRKRRGRRGRKSESSDTKPTPDTPRTSESRTAGDDEGAKKTKRRRRGRRRRRKKGSQGSDAPKGGTRNGRQQNKSDQGDRKNE